MRKYLIYLLIFSTFCVFSQIEKKKIINTWYLKDYNWGNRILKFSTNKLTYGTILKFYNRDSIIEFHGAPCGNDEELRRTIKQGSSTFRIDNDTLFTNLIKVKNMSNKFLISLLKEGELILIPIN